MIASNEKVLKIVAAYFAPSIGINEMTENGQNVSISFHSGYDWEEIKFAAALFDEPGKETEQGTLYTQSLKLTIAGDEETLQERIKELKEAKPIILFEYDNGVQKVIGDKENYCQLESSFSSEGFVTKSELNLYRQSAQRALFLSE